MTSEYKYQCTKCNFYTNYKSVWARHINTVLHKTGKKKIRSDKISAKKCIKCDYKSRTNTNMKQHILINHGTKKEREKEFTYYCKYCDYGTFSKPLYKIHRQTKKHNNIVELLSKISSAHFLQS